MRHSFAHIACRRTEPRSAGCRCLPDLAVRSRPVVLAPSRPHPLDPVARSRLVVPAVRSHLLAPLGQPPLNLHPPDPAVRSRLSALVAQWRLLAPAPSSPRLLAPAVLSGPLAPVARSDRVVPAAPVSLAAPVVRSRHEIPCRQSARWRSPSHLCRQCLRRSRAYGQPRYRPARHSPARLALPPRRLIVVLCE
jgi:hypothetical protein